MSINLVYYPFDFSLTDVGQAFMFTLPYEHGVHQHPVYVYVLRKPDDLVYVKAETAYGALRILEQQGYIRLTPPEIGMGKPVDQPPTAATVI